MRCDHCRKLATVEFGEDRGDGTHRTGHLCEAHRARFVALGFVDESSCHPIRPDGR